MAEDSVIAYAKEPAKAKDGIRDLTAQFINHDMLDASDFLLIGSINRCAIDLVCGD